MKYLVVVQQCGDCKRTLKETQGKSNTERPNSKSLMLRMVRHGGRTVSDNTSLID